VFDVHPLAYLKAFTVGIVAAVAAAVVWIVAPILLTFLVSVRGSVATDGGGGIGAVGFSIYVPTGTSTLVVSLIGFVAGSIWYIRRLRRSRGATA